jgi:D-tyrosyl-tRNA(Tyr) deacylase
MKVVLQRVTKGRCTVDGQITGEIGLGFVALVGVTHTDTQAEAELLAKKTAHLRVFADDEDKMNRSALDVGGGILVISQFTLYADTRRGRRPGFTDAALPDVASPLVDYYAERLRAKASAGRKRRLRRYDADPNPQRCYVTIILIPTT